MKYVLITAMLAGLVCVGCGKPAKTPQTMDPEIGPPVAGPIDPMPPIGANPAPLPPVTRPTPLVGPDPRPMTDVTPITPAPAAPVAGGTYVIKKGDTFIKIAREVYGDPSRMKDIAAANSGVDPRKLKIGQTIILPDVAPKK